MDYLLLCVRDSGCQSRNGTGHVCLMVLVVFVVVSSSSFPRHRARKASASCSSTRKKWPGSTRRMRQISPGSFGNVHSSTSAAASQLTENQSSDRLVRIHEPAQAESSLSGVTTTIYQNQRTCGRTPAFSS